jgi:5-guanidino-2-oxopentanoate decarboxylase
LGTLRALCDYCNRMSDSDALWTVGRYVVEQLAANGIDTVFGIPGVHTLELYRGIAATGMRHVLVRHEQNAGFAADGYARACGKPAAAFVISGPGVTNVLTAVGQASSDSVPMFVVASTPVRSSLGKRWGVLHELNDQHAVVAGVAGHARTAFSDEAVRDHLRALFAALQLERPRPVYLGVPLDLLAEPTSLRPERFARFPINIPVSDETIREAVELLDSADRPVIIAGGGAREAGDEIRKLVEAIDGYVITTAAGKGLLPEGHPANLGASLQFREIQELITGADVVLAVGTELSETDVYTTTRLPMTGRLIRIDRDPTKLSDHYAADIAIHGDARTTLTAITGAVAKRPGWRTDAGEASVQRQEIEQHFGPAARAAMSALGAIREALPSDGIVCTDMTQIAYLGNYAFPADQPGVWFLPSGYGALGYALPAAMGAKIACPRRAVVALAGDFGLQLTLQELLTAVELELSLPVVVWNNNALGQIRDDMQAAGIPPVGVAARNPDFVALARACGAEGIRARGTAELVEAVQGALRRAGPTLVEAVDTDFLPS